MTTTKKKTSPKYYVLDEYKNCDTYAKAPLYDRKVDNPSKFVLSECTQKDLHYLYRRGFRGVALVESETKD